MSSVKRRRLKSSLLRALLPETELQEAVAVEEVVVEQEPLPDMPESSGMAETLTEPEALEGAYVEPSETELDSAPLSDQPEPQDEAELVAEEDRIEAVLEVEPSIAEDVPEASAVDASEDVAPVVEAIAEEPANHLQEPPVEAVAAESSVEISQGEEADVAQETVGEAEIPEEEPDLAEEPVVAESAASAVEEADAFEEQLMEAAAGDDIDLSEEYSELSVNAPAVEPAPDPELEDVEKTRSVEEITCDPTLEDPIVEPLDAVAEATADMIDEVEKETEALSDEAVSAESAEAPIGEALEETIDSLGPVVDLEALPKSQPSRVLAKAEKKGKTPSAKPKKRAARSQKNKSSASGETKSTKRKRISLLDSYFKDI